MRGDSQPSITRWAGPAVIAGAGSASMCTRIPPTCLQPRAELPELRFRKRAPEAVLRRASRVLRIRRRELGGPIQNESEQLGKNGRRAAATETASRRALTALHGDVLLPVQHEGHGRAHRRLKIGLNLQQLFA